MGHRHDETYFKSFDRFKGHLNEYVIYKFALKHLFLHLIVKLAVKIKRVKKSE